MATPESSIPFATSWVLVEDNTECEYRNNISWSPAGLGKAPKRRMVRSKTYEASFVDKDSDNDIVPQYINDILSGSITDAHGDTIANYPNPEPTVVTPIGVNVNQWHIDEKSYTKDISTPMTRIVRITWVMQSSWQDYNDGTQSQNSGQ